MVEEEGLTEEVEVVNVVELTHMGKDCRGYVMLKPLTSSGAAQVQILL